MINKTIQKSIILIVLVLLLIGITSATENNTQNKMTKITKENTQNHQTTPEPKEINKHNTTTNTKTSTTKTPTKLTINKIKTTEFSDKIMITGTYKTNEGKPLKNTVITLNINDKKYTAKTYSSGKYFYKYKTNKVGTNMITATYPGNNKYKAATTKTTFTVTKKKTTLTMNYITYIHYTDTVKILGKLSTKDKTLKNTQITLKINDKTVTRKTNDMGTYSYEYKTKILGKNNITAIYKGNDYYQMAKIIKTFKVTRMPTKLYIYMEQDSTSTYGKKETITGELCKDNYNPLKNTRINIYLNGAIKTVKTDAYGYFIYTFTTQKAGKNTLTAQFIGTNKYIGSKQTITFNVNKMNSYTYLYQPYYDKTNKIIDISGVVYDNQNNYLKKAPVTININGKYYKTTTDNYGYFSYQVKPTKTGTNQITVTYPGNNKFIKSSAQTTINIPIVKATKITMDSISETTLGDYVYITGQFTDNNYNALKNTNIRLTINGKNYNTKTDEYGYYYYPYKTNKAGTNKVTPTYPGNSNYKASSTTKTFTVNYDYHSYAKSQKRYIENPNDYGPHFIVSTIKLNGRYYHRECGGLLENDGYTSSAKDSTVITQRLKCNKCGHVFADYKYDITDFL